MRLEKELKSLLWKIDYDEIVLKRSYASPVAITDGDNLELPRELEVQATLT